MFIKSKIKRSLYYIVIYFPILPVYYIVVNWSRQYLSIDPKEVCHAHSNAHNA